MCSRSMPRGIFQWPWTGTTLNVFIYSNSGGLPGTQVYSTMNQPVTQVGTPSGKPDPAAVLAAGTYWIEIQANMTFTQGEWGWTDRTVQSNNGAAFRNPGGAFGCGTNWVRKPVCVPTTSGPDQVYRINGTIGGGGTPTPTATASPTPTATASCTPSYTFTSGTGTIVPGTTDTGNHCDDCTTVISLPFSVTLYDQTFTSATVGSNGIFAFGTNPNAFGGSCLPVTAATYATMPFYRDQRTDAVGGCTGCGIFTTTTGTAPNRVFRVEYRTIYFGETSATPTLNYEVNVNENGIAGLRLHLRPGQQHHPNRPDHFNRRPAKHNTVHPVRMRHHRTEPAGHYRPEVDRHTPPCGSPTPTPTGTPTCTPSGGKIYNIAGFGAGRVRQ